jgi:hypothetical protein
MQGDELVLGPLSRQQERMDRRLPRQNFPLNLPTNRRLCSTVGSQPQSFFNALNRENPASLRSCFRGAYGAWPERAHDGAISQYPLPFNS